VSTFSCAYFSNTSFSTYVTVAFSERYNSKFWINLSTLHYNIPSRTSFGLFIVYLLTLPMADNMLHSKVGTKSWGYGDGPITRPGESYRV
jgi:hypothetical protein